MNVAGATDNSKYHITVTGLNGGMKTRGGKKRNMKETIKKKKKKGLSSYSIIPHYCLSITMIIAKLGFTYHEMFINLYFIFLYLLSLNKGSV